MRQLDDETDGDFGGGGVPEDEVIDCYTNYGFIEIENPDDPNGPPIEKDIEIQSPKPLSMAELERRIKEEAERWANILSKYERFGFQPPKWTIQGMGVSFGC